MNTIQLTPEQESSREAYLFDKYAERSKQTGDYWWREANAISGLGDWQENDAGEPLQGAKW